MSNFVHNCLATNQGHLVEQSSWKLAKLKFRKFDIYTNAISVRNIQGLYSRLQVGLYMS